jgi:hypothetical protein
MAMSSGAVGRVPEPNPSAERAAALIVAWWEMYPDWLDALSSGLPDRVFLQLIAETYRAVNAASDGQLSTLVGDNPTGPRMLIAAGYAAGEMLMRDDVL